jgi:hypothetical protein
LFFGDEQRMKSFVAGCPSIASAVRAQHLASFVFTLNAELRVTRKNPYSTSSSSAIAALDLLIPISAASRTA